MRILASLCLLSAVPVLGQTYQTVPSMPVTSFIDSLGVNAHNEYNDGDYRKTGETLLELQYLGIHNVRDGVPAHIASDPGNFTVFDPAIRFFMGNGIHFDLGTNCNTAVSSYMTELDSLQAAFPGSIVSVEGTNEVNNQPCNGGGVTVGSTWDAAAIAFQGQLYSAVHSDQALAGIPVYDFTGGTRTGLMAGRADAANNHPYPNLSRGTTVYARMVSDYMDQYSATFTRAITEDGFYTTPDNGDGVDETSQAVGELQIYLSAAALGIPHTYIYELKDAYFPGSPAYSTWGLFAATTGIPKASARSIHSLTTALSWLPATSAPTAVKAQLAGAPSDSKAFAVTDAAGGTLLWLWRDVSPWSVAAQKTIMPAPMRVQVTLDHACSSAYTYDPLHNAIAPVSASGGAYSIGEEPYPVGLYCAR